MARLNVGAYLRWFGRGVDSPNQQELLQARRRQSQHRLHRSAGGYQSNFGDEDWAVSSGVPVKVCCGTRLGFGDFDEGMRRPQHSRGISSPDARTASSPVNLRISSSSAIELGIWRC